MATLMVIIFSLTSLVCRARQRAPARALGRTLASRSGAGQANYEIRITVANDSRSCRSPPPPSNGGGREGEGLSRVAGRLQIMICNRRCRPRRVPPPGLPRMTGEEKDGWPPGGDYRLIRK